MKLFTKEELIQFNEQMLGRGEPVERDGVGYNQADFGACSSYFYGLSNAQYADLAKRLVKYCNTQLGVDKEQMKETQKHYEELAGRLGYDREDGISLNITENGTLISFRYNETFIETIKKQPKRQWDAENKNWIVPNNMVIPTLNELWTIGADVGNALEYAMHNDLVNQHSFEPEVEIKTILDDDYALIKFDYNKEIVDAVKKIDRAKREYNPKHKYWKIKKECFEGFKQEVSALATFKFK